MNSKIKGSIKEILSYLASEILIARREQNKERSEKLMIAFKVLSEEYEKID